MSRETDGGRNAARGLRYQYLRTLEAMLSLVDDDTIAAVRIEGPHGPDQVNAVDFDVVDIERQVRVAAQVKSVAVGATVSAATAFGQLVKLTSEHEATQYQLLTNARPDPSAKQLSRLLAANTSPTELRKALDALLTNAKTRRAELDALNDKQLHRLSRSRVLFDGRDISELRDELRESMRSYRNQQRDGLGAQSAGLLTRALTADIFDCAADATQSAFSMNRFRERLLIDGAALAATAGSRDWGIVVGAMSPIPDVARPDYLCRIVAAFDVADRRRPARVVLTGSSGVGKSSLAAFYIADRADTYDVIFWVDGESEFTLLAAFRQILIYLGAGADAVAGLTAAETRTQAHTALTRFAGRWALVIDNISDPRNLQIWIPTIGGGHILLTSIDARARYGPATRIEIDAMTPDQSVTLLARRLGLEHASGLPADHRSALLRLAHELGNLPLALELAAGYFDSCGIQLDQVDTYLEQLKVRSLADEESIPDGYPRTLLRAVALCLEDLQSRAQRPEGKMALLAFGMIGYAAYLGSRQLPLQLLAAAVVIDPADQPHPLGMLLLDPSEFPLGEAVRELRRYSLVTYDADLPQGADHRGIGADRTITINTVLQDLLRVILPAHEGTTGAFDQLANHVERWHTAAVELNLLHRASVLFSHADALARHLHGTHITSERIALLFGNLAAAYRIRGDTATAVDLLRTECHVLRREPEPNELLLVQAELALIELLTTQPEPTQTTPGEIVAFLKHAIGYAQGIADEAHDAAVRIIYQTKRILDTPALIIDDKPGIHQIKQECESELTRLGSSDYTRAIDALLDANLDISAMEYARAEQNCRTMLDSGILIGQPELLARRILTEALAAQNRWDEAATEFSYIKQLFGAASMHHDIVADLVHNTGLRCAMNALTGSDTAAIELLADLISWPPVKDADSFVSHEYNARLRLLTAIGELANGERGAMQRLLSTVTPHELANDSPEGRGWALLWQQFRLAAIQLP